MNDEFDVDADPARVDAEALWHLLSTQAYWARWRSRAEFERQIAGAWRVVGAYDRATGRTLGFARALSDGVCIAYLADVLVLDEARGRGIGTALVREMIEAGPGAAYRWMLHTVDAHGLYERFGFAAPDATYLERPARRVAAEP